MYQDERKKVVYDNLTKTMKKFDHKNKRIIRKCRSNQSITLTFTSRLREQLWIVEAHLEGVALTSTAHQRQPLRVLQADVQRDLALGRGNHGRVGQAHLQGKIVLGIEAKPIPGNRAKSCNVL